MAKTLITAHTGCMNTPPNSIQSVLEGIKTGAEIIEVDVNVTKDGIAVLVHDDHVSTPFGNKRVHDLTFEELKGLSGKGEIIRLEDVLPLIQEHHRVVNLDVKADHAVEPMIRTVEKYGMRNDVIISGCEKERATYVKDHYRPYQVLLNASASLYASHGNNYELFVKQTCRDAVEASCCGININHRHCRESLVEYASLRCLPVLVWTVDDPQAMEQFLDLGVYSITSNEIQTLVHMRNHRK